MTKPLTPPVWKAIKDHPGEFYDGQVYLAALRVVCSGKERWEYHKIAVECDSESPVSFYYADTDLIGHKEYFTEWDWDDFEFYIEVES